MSGSGNNRAVCGCAGRTPGQTRGAPRWRRETSRPIAGVVENGAPVTNGSGTPSRCGGIGSNRTSRRTATESSWRMEPRPRSEDAEACRPIRRGWCCGEAEFRSELPAQTEERPPNAPAPRTVAKARNGWRDGLRPRSSNARTGQPRVCRAAPGRPRAGGDRKTVANRDHQDPEMDGRETAHGRVEQRVRPAFPLPPLRILSSRTLEECHSLGPTPALGLDPDQLPSRSPINFSIAIPVKVGAAGHRRRAGATEARAIRLPLLQNFAQAETP